jgi:hypothetical protein
MPKIVTTQQRKDEAADHADKLNAAIRVACATDSDPNATEDDRREQWAVVANHAGQIQRRARIVAGLGRGG